MQIKRIMALVLSFLIISSVVTVNAYAEDLSPIVEGEDVSEYVNVQSISNTLTISSTTAYCDSICTGFSNVVRITAVQTIQKFWGLWIWDSVDGGCWTDSVNSASIGVSHNKSGLTSGTYRLKTDFSITTSS